jgi:flagellar hook assembly protein FlgD
VVGFGNGVADQPVDFALVSGPGTLTPLDSQTDVDGVARADFLSPRGNAMTRIQASSNALAIELDVETALVDPTASAGSITNFPNPFHPDEAPTTIAYKLSDNANVTVRIYTLHGGLVWREQFVMGDVGGTVGLNQITWDGRNGDGELVASGGYIAVVESNGNGESQVMRRKIAVVR